MTSITITMISGTRRPSVLSGFAGVVDDVLVKLPPTFFRYLRSGTRWQDRLTSVDRLAACLSCASSTPDGIGEQPL